MEDSNKKLSQEDLKPDSNQKSSFVSLDEGKEMGIKLTRKGIDGDSSRETDDISKESPLNEKLIKKALEAELEKAIYTLKNEVKTEGQEIKKDFLTIFGLFASFVTFLSIEVQVFKNKDNFHELIGISSISLSFVIFFAIVINDIAKDKNEWKDFLKPTYIITLMFAIVGILSLYYGGKSSISQVNTLEKKIQADSTLVISQNFEIETMKGEIEVLDSLIKEKTPIK